VIDTGELKGRRQPMKAGVRSKVAGRSVLVLREHSEPAAAPDRSAAASVAAQEQSAAQNGRAGTP
jgi:hypothetical protein